MNLKKKIKNLKYNLVIYFNKEGKVKERM